MVSSMLEKSELERRAQTICPSERSQKCGVVDPGPRPRPTALRDGSHRLLTAAGLVLFIPVSCVTLSIVCVAEAGCVTEATYWPTGFHSAALAGDTAAQRLVRFG
ncbi:hypothetical protein ACJJTC_010814 [Scirpophaga incertulas]